MLERGYPIGYHPVELAARIGTSKVTLRAGFASMLLVVRVIMMFAPMRIFLPFALMLLGVGAVYSLTLALVVREGFPVLRHLPDARRPDHRHARPDRGPDQPDAPRAVRDDVALPRAQKNNNPPAQP